jgi:hypothetical protein
MVYSNNRAPGLSFVIRARNEAQALFDNFASLSAVTVPHEIIVVLHRCTDESKTVAEVWNDRGLPIFIVEDKTPISRAGYETLVTPAFHPNSLPEFYNRAFGHAKYRWLLKWDADFVATEYFLDIVNNSLDLDLREPTAHRLQCELGADAVCHEDYMFNAWYWYGKHYCWEFCRQAEPKTSVEYTQTCIKSCSPKVIKDYWHEQPWFLREETYDADLAEKYKILVNLVGPEPAGFARSNNPDFAEQWARLVTATPELEKHGIYANR